MPRKDEWVDGKNVSAKRLEASFSDAAVAVDFSNHVAEFLEDLILVCRRRSNEPRESVMTIVNIDQYTERQQRAANRILEQMDRTQSRTDTQYTRSRKHKRKHFRCAISVFVPTAEQREAPSDGQGTFTAWCYSLSQGGVGFIAPTEISCQEVLIGIQIPNGSLRWMSGRVVRQRAVPEEEFLDYGVAFHAAHRVRQPEEAVAAQ